MSSGYGSGSSSSGHRGGVPLIQNYLDDGAGGDGGEEEYGNGQASGDGHGQSAYYAPRETTGHQEYRK